MRRTGVWAVLWACALLALGGCGSGDVNPFDQFFGGGAAPGGAFSTVEPGRITGVVVARTADGRVQILASPDEVTAAVSPVAGAVVTLVDAGATQTTGGSGVYDFTGVTPGEYTVRFTVPQQFGGATAEFRVTVGPAQVVQGIPTGTVPTSPTD